MKKTTLNLVLLYTLTLSGACSEQNQHKNTGPDNRAASIGKVVSALDQQIWSIYQDQDQNYWFGSNGSGVFLYDGTMLRQFSTEDGLADDQIRQIIGDSTGNVYFDTPQGVSKFDGQAFTTLIPTFSPQNKWALQPDDLWFKGNGNKNGVYRYDGQSLIFLPFPEYDLETAFGRKFEESPFSPYGVYSIYKDKKGNMWFGTLAAGVCRFDGTSHSWISEKELSVLEDGRAPGVRSIIEDKDGNFWLSNTLNRYNIIGKKFIGPGKNTLEYEKLKGIDRFDGKNEMEFPYYLSAVTDKENNDLWMVTYDSGVWRYDGKELFQYSIKNDDKTVFLLSIYKDRQGTLWLGTQNAGLYKFNGNEFEQFRIK